MSSLRHCLQKMGLAAHEAAILKGAVKDLTADGYDAQKAAETAVRDYIQALEDERADIVRQVREKAPQAEQSKVDAGTRSGRPLGAVQAEIDAIFAAAKARRDAARDPAIRGMRPAEADWMTEDELNLLPKLQSDIIGDTPGAAAQRVAEKRAARVAAMRESQPKTAGDSDNILFDLSDHEAPIFFSALRQKIAGDVLRELGLLRGKLIEDEVPHTRIVTMMRRWDAGKINDKEMLEAVREELARREKLKDRSPQARVRGTDWIRERLIRARRTGELSNRETDLALWLIDKSPGIAEDLGISIKAGNRDDANGSYNKLARLVTIFSGKSNALTATHEILHHTERMMPPEVQAGIRKEWLAQLRKQVAEQRPNVPVGQQVLLDWMLEAAEKGDTQLALTIWKGVPGNNLQRVLSYKYASPSEFWAVNGSELVRKRMLSEQAGWVEQAKQWLRELIEKVKSLFGLTSEAPVIRGLEAVLRGDGSFVTHDLISEGADTEAKDVTLEDRTDSDLADDAKDLKSKTSRTEEPSFAAGMTDQQKATLRKVGLIREQPTLAGRLAEALQSFRKSFVQGVFDQFAPLKDIDLHAYKMARLSSASDGGVEALLLYGKPFLDGDAVDVKIEKDGKGGFLHVLQWLDGEHDRFFAWIAGKRAAELKKQGRENLLTDEDIGFLATLNAGTMRDGSDRGKAFYLAQKRLAEFNNAVLDIAEKSGLFDAESRALWAQQFYVPFFRVMEEGVAGPSIKSGLVNQYGVKKLKGGTAELNDLLKNTLMNWAHLMSAAAKNRAAAESIKALDKIGGVLEANEDVVRSMGKTVGEKAVSYLDNGIRRWVLVEDPHVLDALTSLQWGGFGPIMKPLQMFKHWLTFGVTISPTFRVANLMRDTIAAIGQTPVSFNPFKNLMDGWKATDRSGQGYASMLAGGGMFRFGTLLEGQRAEHVRRLVDSGIKDFELLDKPSKLKALAQKVWDAYQDLGDRSENVNRAALYEQLRANGYSHLDASYMARDLLDFSLQGKWALIRFLVQVVPFMNARLQGLYKLGRAGVEDKKRFGAVVAAVAAASLALMLMQQDDEDWKRREDWDRDAYWWVKIGGYTVRIPKPFEIGALGTLAERTWELAFNDEMTGARYRQRLADMFANTFALSPVPQLVKPVLDVYANRDSFTGRPIESPGMERLVPTERATAGTSEVARLLGQIGLPEPAQLLQGRYEPLSPVQVDHMLRGYFASLAVGGNMVIDAMFRPLMDRPERPDRGLSAIPLTGRFVQDLPSQQSRYVTEFYEQASRLEQAFTTYREALKRGDKEGAAAFLAADEDKVRAGAAANRYREVMARYNLLRRQIEADKTIDGDEKRKRITEIQRKQEALAKDFLARGLPGSHR